MTNKQKLTALYHSAFTALGLFIVFAVLFCIFPTQTWMIPIVVLSLAVFIPCIIVHNNKKGEWGK